MTDYKRPSLGLGIGLAPPLAYPDDGTVGPLSPQRNALDYYFGPHLSQSVNALGRVGRGLLDIFDPVAAYHDSVEAFGRVPGLIDQGAPLQAAGQAGLGLFGALGTVPFGPKAPRGNALLDLLRAPEPHPTPETNALVKGFMAGQDSGVTDDFAKRAREAAEWYAEYRSGIPSSQKAKRAAFAERMAAHLTPDDLAQPGLAGYEAALKRMSAPRMPSRFDLSDKDSLASALRQALGGKPVMEGRAGSGSSRYIDFDGGRLRVSDHTAVTRRSFEHSHEVIVRRSGDEIMLDVNGTELRLPAGSDALRSKETLQTIVDLLKRNENGGS